MPGTLGVVLAGGRGARLAAGRPKAAVDVAGRSLLARACATLAPLVTRTVLVAPHDVALPEAPGAARVHDDGRGPLAAVAAAIGAAGEARCVVLAADLPLVTPELLEALERARQGAPASVAVVAGVTQPMALWLGAEGMKSLVRRAAAGEESLARALEDFGARLVPAASLPGGEAAFLDVDTPDDLAEVERRLAERAS